MRFLEQQQAARRKAKVFLLQFAVLAVIGVLLMDLLVAVLLVPFTNGTSLAVLSVFVLLFFPGGAEIAADPRLQSLFVLVTAVSLCFFVLVVLWKRRKLRRAGEYLATRLSCVPVGPESREPDHRRLLNVTQEMALAAGIPAPAVYVYPEESALNAFAAGHTVSDASIFVTSRALRSPTREELQALVAHEISHILNGDMALNVRLVAYLCAFNIVPRVGLGLLGLPFRQKNFGEAIRSIPAWLIFGLTLGTLFSILGSIHRFAARLLQASICRQQEVLADASAVQFTRNPLALKGVLLKVLAVGSIAAKRPSDLEDGAHMFFASILARRWLATHPPLRKRLLAIDPHLHQSAIDAVLQREKRRVAAEAEERRIKIETMLPLLGSAKPL